MNVFHWLKICGFRISTTATTKLTYRFHNLFFSLGNKIVFPPNTNWHFQRCILKLTDQCLMAGEFWSWNFTWSNWSTVFFTNTGRNSCDCVWKNHIIFLQESKINSCIPSYQLTFLPAFQPVTAKIRRLQHQPSRKIHICQKLCLKRK